MPTPIYLDHNATTPILPEVVEAMRACWTKPFLNPASQHGFGRQAFHVLEGARHVIADLLGAGKDDGLVFTSGGTESNNLAIRSLLQRTSRATGGPHDPRRGGCHLVVSAIEHPSIANLAKELRNEGHKVDELPVDQHGVIRVNRLAPMLRRGTTLVAAILGQNETGVVQPVAELATVCATHGIPLHTDATQVAGKLPIDFQELGAATMTVTAHKFHGPVGIGALVVRHGVELQPQLFGGFQQAGLRPGTESVALAVGMSRALQGIPDLDLDQSTESVRAAHTLRLLDGAQRMRELRDHFERSILAGWPSAIVLGAKAVRLPNTSNIAFVGLERQMLFIALDQAGIACSTGSACASGSSEPSPTHIAMGCEPAVISSALRFSFGVTTTAAEVEEAACRILKVCNGLGR
jgi:cysteine desulfurase